MTALVQEGAAHPVDRYISLRQPWASLFVAGAKTIETRSWGTKFRGRLAVHASKTFGRDEIAACFRQPFARTLTALGLEPLRMPRGAIIGWVTIADCLEMVEKEPLETPPGKFPIGRMQAPWVVGDARLTEVERAFGYYAPLRYAWLTNRHRLVLPTPIPMKALQRIQRLPEAVARELNR